MKRRWRDWNVWHGCTNVFREKVEKKIKKHSLRKILENGGILNGEEFEIMLKEEAEERRDSKLEEINQNIIQLNKTMYEILKIISNNQ